MSTAKDRSMATGPYPLRCTMRPIKVEGTWCAGSYSTHIVGTRAIIVLSDGTEVPCCDGRNGHKVQARLIDCATNRVAQLNDAAGIPEAVR